MNKTEKSIIHSHRDMILTTFKDLFRAYTIAFNFFSSELKKKNIEIVKMIEGDKQLHDYEQENFY